MQLRIENGRAQLRTRSGLDWSDRFPEIQKEAVALPDCIVDGEVVAVDARGISHFGGLQSALSSHNTDRLIFYAFDLLFLQGSDLREQALAKRKDLLRALLAKYLEKSKRLRFVDHFGQSGEAMLDAACRMHLEGIISKRLDAPYRSGRTADWLKLKCRGGQEVVIGGWWGDADQLRSILVGVWRGGDLHYMGRIGTGFDSTNARQLLGALKPLRRSSAPFANRGDIPRTRGVTWVEPKLVAEVEFGTVTEAGLLRQASFKGLREDKEARTVKAEPQPAARAQTKRKPESRTAGKNSVSVADITVTNAGKELWPADGSFAAVTKADLARYYEAAADRLLPRIAGRPLSIVRAPDGIDGQRFFQRHAPPGTSHVQPIKVKGEAKPYLGIDSLAGLVALAQAAVLEIHPWGAQRDAPEIPELLIFDLDPAPDVPFARVMEAAKEIRARLDACGLVPFLKTTGGKGLHVVTAIAGSARKPATWTEAKSFARAVCEAVAKAEPELYTTNMSKKTRGGKIFLDYLRNDRTATAVAAWSPRARPHAPIALPLPWNRLRKDLDPAKFTLAGARTLLRAADPWKDLDASAAPLRDAMKKLDG